MAVCNANTLLASAACFQCLSKKELQMIIVQLLCNISVDGTGGGSYTVTISNAQVWAAAGVPAHTPTATAQIYFDINTGIQWNYYNGSWH